MSEYQGVFFFLVNKLSWIYMYNNNNNNKNYRTKNFISYKNNFVFIIFLFSFLRKRFLLKMNKY